MGWRAGAPASAVTLIALLVCLIPTTIGGLLPAIGIAGMDRLERKPDVLIVDILLPGIDGATLITSLRSHPQFARSRLIVVTSLAEADRGPYAFALQGVPVIHKPRLVMDLPPLLTGWLPAATRSALPAPAGPASLTARGRPLGR